MSHYLQQVETIKPEGLRVSVRSRYVFSCDTLFFDLEFFSLSSDKIHSFDAFCSLPPSQSKNLIGLNNDRNSLDFFHLLIVLWKVF